MFPIAYGTYDALLSDPSLDAIYIPLPPSMHAEWTINAAKHGKHVLCEKPLSAKSDEATIMADACHQNGVQLMDGVMWVHHERTAMMKEKLAILGELRRVTAAFTFNWNTIPTGNIRAKAELGGGSLGDLGYYCARAILWAFEEMPQHGFSLPHVTKSVWISILLVYSGLTMIALQLWIVGLIRDYENGLRSREHARLWSVMISQCLILKSLPGFGFTAQITRNTKLVPVFRKLI